VLDMISLHFHELTDTPEAQVCLTLSPRAPFAKGSSDKNWPPCARVVQAGVQSRFGDYGALSLAFAAAFMSMSTAALLTTAGAFASALTTAASASPLTATASGLRLGHAVRHRFWCGGEHFLVAIFTLLGRGLLAARISSGPAEPALLFVFLLVSVVGNRNASLTIAGLVRIVSHRPASQSWRRLRCCPWIRGRQFETSLRIFPKGQPSSRCPWTGITRIIGHQRWCAAMSLTLEQRTSLKGIPKPAELIEISGAHALGKRSAVVP
jgi:hypothetical protein